MKYVALLRGINVGGNNKISMAALRGAFESMGFTEVRTYINSGNVIFDAVLAPTQAAIQEHLKDEFGFDISTLLLKGEDIVRIAAAIPKEWKNDRENEKSDVLYLFDEANSPDVLARIGFKPEIETLIYVDHAVLANITRKNQGRGSLLKLMGIPLYKQMTIRNVTTARKLAELVV
jgi:uncharacterized protein (DUF1697 family)